MERYTKSSFVMKVTSLKDTAEGMKIIDTKLVNCRGRDFSISMAADQVKGINRKIQYVNKEPENWQLGVIYIRLDGKKAWVWNKVEEETGLGKVMSTALESIKE